MRALNGTEILVPAGQFLIRQGERVDRIWIVLDGKLHAACFGAEGKEFLYQQLLPGYLAAGEVACTPKKTSPYDVYAVENCRLWSCPWSALHQVPPELQLTLYQNLLAFVANQNIRKYYKIDALSVKGARDRILKYLTAQAQRTGSRSFTIPMNREAMANYLCLNRSVLSHELKQMEAEGLLRFRKNYFTLL